LKEQLGNILFISFVIASVRLLSFILNELCSRFVMVFILHDIFKGRSPSNGKLSDLSSILIAKNLLTGSLQNRSIDNLETRIRHNLFNLVLSSPYTYNINIQYDMHYYYIISVKMLTWRHETINVAIKQNATMECY
jgi:hypothetical protein